MMSELSEKFDNLKTRLSTDAFKDKHGLSGEVPYFIMDYKPNEELVVREEVKRIAQAGPYGSAQNDIKVFDLFDIAMSVVDEFDYRDYFFNFEREDGMDYVVEQMNNLMETNSENNRFVEYIQSRIDPAKDIVFIIGVGRIFPLIRSHKVLNTMTQVIDNLPVVMFYPGDYDNIRLSMFGELKDDNYYRATQIN